MQTPETPTSTICDPLPSSPAHHASLCPELDTDKEDQVNKRNVIALALAMSSGGMALPTVWASATAAYQQQEILAQDTEIGALNQINNDTYQMEQSQVLPGTGTNGTAPVSIFTWQPTTNTAPNGGMWPGEMAYRTMWATQYTQDSLGPPQTAGYSSSSTPDGPDYTLPVFATGNGQTATTTGREYGTGHSVFQWMPNNIQSRTTTSQFGGNSLTVSPQWPTSASSYTSPWSVWTDKYGIPNQAGPHGDSVFKRVSDTDYPGQRTLSAFLGNQGQSVFTYEKYNPNTGTYYGTQTLELNSQGNPVYMPSTSVFTAALSTATGTAPSSTGRGSVFVTDDTNNRNIGHSVFLDKYNNSYLDDITSDLELNTAFPPTYDTATNPTYSTAGSGMNEFLYGYTENVGLAAVTAAINGMVQEPNGYNSGELDIIPYTLPFAAIQSQQMSGMPTETPYDWYTGPTGQSAINQQQGTFTNYFAQAFYAPPASSSATTLTPYLSALIGYPTADQTADANDVGNEMNTVTAQIGGDWSSLTEALGNQFHSGTGTGSLLANPDVQEALPMLLPVYTDYIAWATPVHGISTNSLIAPYQATLYATAGGNSGPEFGEPITTTQQEINGNTFITVDPTSQTNAFTTQQPLYPSTVQPSTGLTNPTAPGGSNVMYAVMTGMQEGFLDWDQTGVPDGGLRPLFTVIWTIMLLLYTLRIMNWALTGGPIPIITFSRTPDAPNTDLLTSGRHDDNPGLPAPGAGGPPIGLYGPQLGTGDGMIDADYRVLHVEELPGGRVGTLKQTPELNAGNYGLTEGNQPRQLGGGT
jgi:hypothetical protein